MGLNQGSASTNLIVNGTGSVGIGTATPTEKLHVEGNTITAKVILDKSANLCIFTNASGIIIANNLTGVTC